MGSHGRANIDKKGKLGKCKRDNTERKIRSHQKDVNASNPREPQKMKGKLLPTCRVMLTRCNGRKSPDRSAGTVKSDGDNTRSGDRINGENYKSESGRTKSETRRTFSDQLSSRKGAAPRISTQVQRKRHKCQFCSKSLVTTADLEVHIRSHTGERPYHCKLCSKSFVQTGNLKMHIRSHTGEKPHQCERCSKWFVTRQVLKHHIRTHTGERPHQCPLCSKSFALLHHLKGHMRSHTGERPYKCQICLKAFAQSGSLETHIRTHTGERPYKCQFCSKSFALGYSLKGHMRTHTTK